MSLLVIELRVDRPLLHVRLLAVPPGLVREQIQADVRVRAFVAAREKVPVGNRGTR